VTVTQSNFAQTTYQLVELPLEFRVGLWQIGQRPSRAAFMCLLRPANPNSGNFQLKEGAAAQLLLG